MHGSVIIGGIMFTAPNLRACNIFGMFGCQEIPFPSLHKSLSYSLKVSLEKIVFLAALESIDVTLSVRQSQCSMCM